MLKRRVYLILLVLVLVGVVVVLATREREPEYGGKRLSEWVKDLPALWMQERPDLSHERARESEQAVRQIGTNASPYLLRWIEYDPPGWKVRLQVTFNRIAGRLNLSRDLTNIERDSLRSFDAMSPLIELGPKADGVIGDLTRMAHGPKARGVRNRALVVLGALGTNAARAVPDLLDILNDPDPKMREVVKGALRQIDPKALEKATP